MTTNEALIEHLKKNVLVTPRIEQAFRSVDRVRFVPEEFIAYAYEDQPLAIGYGATISQPWTVAFMLEKLQPEPGNSVLDIGAGSGWTTALLEHIVVPGRVIGTEIIPALVSLANERLTNAHVELATSLGKPGKQFDRVLVSAAARGRVPPALLEQLAPGGRLVVPVDDVIVLVERSGERYTEYRWHGFSFVPLRHA